MQKPLKDSGSRRRFKTGAQRDIADGKGRFDLLPARALRRLAIHFERGAAKYAARNWEKGQPLSVYADSGLRHAFSYLQGMRDEDHLIAAAWNLLCLADTEERIKDGLLPAELDDLPKPNESCICRRPVQGAQQLGDGTKHQTRGISITRRLAGWCSRHLSALKYALLSRRGTR